MLEIAMKITPAKLKIIIIIWYPSTEASFSSFPQMSDQKGAVLNKIITTPRGSFAIAKMFKKVVLKNIIVETSPIPDSSELGQLPLPEFQRF